MKYGIVYHKYTTNLGDDIMPYASSRMLPQVDYVLNREYIDDFETDDGEPVSVLMNHWWFWNKWNWPPSPCINPKFVGYHLMERDIFTDGSAIKFEFLEGLGGDYMKSYGPIGCRDYHTTKILDEIGIDNYFSGCVTLTLPKMKVIKPEREYICIVDLPKKSEKKVVDEIKKQNPDVDIKFMTHLCDYTEGKESWQERSQIVEKYLTVYQNAKCVVTTRLHVALPCLAMETPVYFVHVDRTKSRFTENQDTRYDVYTGWVHNIKNEDILKGRLNYDFKNPKPNPNDYLATRNALISEIEKFVEDSKSIDSIPEFTKTNYSDEERRRWQFDLMKYGMEKWIWDNRVMRSQLIEAEEKAKSLDKIMKTPIGPLIKLYRKINKIRKKK